MPLVNCIAQLSDLHLCTVLFGLATGAGIQQQSRLPPRTEQQHAHLALDPSPSAPQHKHRVAKLNAAAAHHQLTRTPLQAPFMQPSHTNISMPLGLIDLYGNYSVQGPAVIRKVNNSLVALVQPGGAVSVLCSPTEGPTVMSSASLSHDEDVAAWRKLMGQHLELDGSFILANANTGIQHDGKTILSVASLSEAECITLLPGGSVSHPVNVHPHRP